MRDEIRAPLSDTLPDELAALVRSRVRDAELLPVVRLRSDRDVRAPPRRRRASCSPRSAWTPCTPSGSAAARGDAQWTEIEVELADGGDPAFLDKVEKRLRKAGVRPSTSSSKLARALAETAPTERKAASRDGRAVAERAR